MRQLTSWLAATGKYLIEMLKFFATRATKENSGFFNPPKTGALTETLLSQCQDPAIGFLSPLRQPDGPCAMCASFAWPDYFCCARLERGPA